MLGSIICGIVIAFFAVILIRAIRFRPTAQTSTTSEPIEFDRQAPVDALAQLIRCKTISYHDHSLEDDAEFEKLIALLPQLYPMYFSIAPLISCLIVPCCSVGPAKSRIAPV